MVLQPGECELCNFTVSHPKEPIMKELKVEIHRNRSLFTNMRYPTWSHIQSASQDNF